MPIGIIQLNADIILFSSFSSTKSIPVSSTKSLLLFSFISSTVSSVECK